MIHEIAETISTYFYSTHIIESQEKDTCRYGLEILISTLIGFGAIIITGVILGEILISFLYLLIIIPTRMCTGGYHAESYAKCNIIFCAVFASVVFLYQLLIISNLKWIILLLNIISLYVVIKYAPVENKFKPTSEIKQKRFKKISIMIFVIGFFSSALLMRFQFNLGILISLTMFAVAFLIWIEMIKNLVKKGWLPNRSFRLPNRPKY